MQLGKLHVVLVHLPIAWFWPQELRICYGRLHAESFSGNQAYTAFWLRW